MTLRLEVYYISPTVIISFETKRLLEPQFRVRNAAQANIANYKICRYRMRKKSYALWNVFLVVGYHY